MERLRKCLGRALVACVALGVLGCLGAAPAMASPPPNDNFANAGFLAPGGTASADNTEATREPGEAVAVSDEAHAGPTLWYRMIPGSGSRVTLSTCGSAGSIDTVIGVFVGTSLNSLSKVVSGDDEGCAPKTSISFDAQEGVAYSIQVSTYGGSPPTPPGPIFLSTSFASNATPNSFAGADELNLAPAVPAFGGTLALQTIGATKEASEPSHGGNNGGKSVWYTWRAPASGSVTVDTCGSAFDTLLGVYTGTAVNALTTIGSSDDDTACGAASSQSSVTFTAAAGTLYRIAVDGYNLNPGNAASAAAGAGFIRLREGIDATGPGFLVDGPSGTVSSGSAFFHFGTTEYATTRMCSLDGDVFMACTGSYAGLSDGPHTFQARETDAYGNTGTSDIRNWTVDTTPPDTLIDTGPSGSTDDPTPTFGFHATEGGSTFKCSIDQGIANFGACSDLAAHTPDPALADGDYTFRVRGTDAVGNVDPDPATQSFSVTTVDSAPPGALLPAPVALLPAPAQSPVPKPRTCKKRSRSSAAAAKRRKCRKKRG